MLGLYKALYDYVPQDPETELPLSEDQVIYILDKEDPEWWKARTKPTDGSAAEDGPVGLVPSNYVEEAAPLYRARAIYAYTATTAEELSIQEDEPLLIFEADEGDEWVLARRVAEPEQLGGYVPATYVQEEEGTAGEEGFNGDAVDEIEGPPQATYVDPAELSAERRDKSKADSIETWVVSELDGKKKKTKGTLGIGNGAIFFASESSKNPIQQHPIDEVEAVSLSGKDISLDLPALGGQPWAFHCASSAEAEAVHAKLHASKDASGGTFSVGSDHVNDDEHDRAGGLSVHTGSAAPKAVRWAPSPTSPAAATSAGDDDEETAVALYDFAAEGGADELVLTEGERLVVIDKSGDGWWKVRNSQGEEGVVPEAYVELGAGGAADDDDDTQREDEERAAAAEAEAAAIAAANAERAQAEAERRRQMEERRSRQEAEEKRRRKEEERARRDEEARQREEARRQTPAPEPPKIRSRPSANDVPASIPHKSGLPSRPQESSSSRSLPAPNKIRTWHDKSGQFKVEAEFLGFKGGKIRLHKVNGVVIEVPLAKMSPEDSEYIDRLTAKQQQRRRPAHDDDDVPLAQSHANKARPTVSLQPQSQGRSAVASAPSGRPPAQQQRRRPAFDWFEFFLDAGVDVDDCTRYAANFDRDKIDETILEDLDPGTLRNLGLREGDVIRVKKAIAARKAPPPPPNGGGDSRSQIESDEAFARRLQEEENGGRRSGGTSSPAQGGSGGGSGLFTSSTGELKNQTRRGRPERKGTAPESVDAASLVAASSSLARSETPPAVAVSPPAPVNPPQRTTSAAPAASLPPPATVSTGFDDDAWTPRPSSTKPATPTPPTAPVAPQLVSFDSAQAVPQVASSAFESLAQPGQARPPAATAVQQSLSSDMGSLSIGPNNTGSSSMQAPQSFHNGLGFGGSNSNMGQLLQAQQTGMFQQQPQQQQQGPRAPPAPVPSSQGLLNPLVPTQTGFGQFVPTRSSGNSSPFQGMQPQQTGFMPQQTTGYPGGNFQSTPSYLPPQHTAMNTNYQAGQVMANQNALSSADTFNQLASARPQPPPSAAQPASFNPSSVFAAMKNNKGVLDQSAAPQGSDKYDALRSQTTGFPGMMQQPQFSGLQPQQPQMGFMQAQQTGFPMQQQMPTGMPMQPSFMGPQPTGFMPQQQTGFNPYGQQQGGYRGF